LIAIFVDYIIDYECIMAQLKETVVLEAATVRQDVYLSVLLDRVAHFNMHK